MLAAAAREFTMVVGREESSLKPRGLRPEETQEKNAFTVANRARWRGDAYDDSRYDDTRPDAPKWIDARTVEAGARGTFATMLPAEVTTLSARVSRLTITTPLSGSPTLDGVRLELTYEVHDAYPAIRKWVKHPQRRHQLAAAAADGDRRPVLRQKCVRRHVFMLQRVHSGDADRRVAVAGGGGSKRRVKFAQWGFETPLVSPSSRPASLTWELHPSKVMAHVERLPDGTPVAGEGTAAAWEPGVGGSGFVAFGLP
jgi:hypothetical protein